MKFLQYFALFILSSIGINAYAFAPAWYSDYVSNFPDCAKESLCTVGVGETLNDALAGARSEVSKYFQNKIKSKTIISNSSEQKGSIAANASVDEWTQKSIAEESNEVITGLEIKKQEQVNDHFYVLLTLDRSKTAKLLKDKMEILDGENIQLINLNSRFAYPKILNNWIKLEFLKERYLLLSQIDYHPRVTKDLILDKISKLKVLKILIGASSARVSNRLNNFLLETLAPLKIIIVSKKQKPQYILNPILTTEEQYFKVEGFKKINVQLKLELVNKSNIVFGKTSALSEQVARTSGQAIEKALPEIFETVRDNLNQLSNSKLEE
jgi:hypothetical protein